LATRAFSSGKLKPSLLEELVFQFLGRRDSRVIVGPRIGEDAAAIDFKGRVLVIHSDPITGATNNIGWLAVNVCANDIATRGVRPRWLLVVMLLPENLTHLELKRIASQIGNAAKELGVAIVGGHSEITPGITRPILVTTALGETARKKLISTGGAEISDYIIITKGAAIEGTAILASEMSTSLESKVGRQIVQGAQGFIRRISVVHDALTATRVEGVHAMHDVTEGGVAGGLQEVAWASRVGINVYEEKIPVYDETKAICKALGIDPLRTIGSGSLLVVADSMKAAKIVSALERKGIQASVIGTVVDEKSGSCIVRRDGTKLDLSEPVKDEIWKILGTRYR
jgi:hydrogenase maturation factor